MRQRLLPKQLPAFLTRLRKTDGATITSDPTVEDRSRQPASSPLAISADSSDTEAVSSPLVRKYEIGSGADKVNVRIYKEPPMKPIIAELPGDAESKQVDRDALILRWKKDGNGTPIEPSNCKI